MPTVNKITLATGQTSSISPYASSGNPPTGILVSANDLDGDGVADLIVAPTSGPATVNVRGWYGSSKSASVPTFSNGYRAVASGRRGSALATVGYAATFGPTVKVSSWDYGPTTDGTTGLANEQHAVLDGFDADRPIGLAFDNTALDDTALIVAGQRTINDAHKGVLNIIRRTGAPVRTITAFDETYGGGVQVAAGDIDHDGHSEIVALARNKTPSNTDCLMIAVYHENGVEAVRFPWRTALDTSVAPDGAMTGRVAVGDVDGDGRAEVIVTKATATGPLCTIFKLDGGTNGTPLSVDAGTPLNLKIDGLPSSGDPALAYCALDVAFTALPFDDALAPSANALTTSNGTLVFGLSVVPEPTTLASVGALMALAARRRR